MKLKYYLRGLGIGIIITALIMKLAPGAPEEMTDAEIKRRAAELGMVEEADMTLEDAAKLEKEKDGEGVPVSVDKALQNNVSQNNVSQNNISRNAAAGSMSGNTVSADSVSDNSVSGDRAAGSGGRMPETGSVLDEAEDGQAERAANGMGNSSSKRDSGSTKSSSVRKTADDSKSSSVRKASGTSSSANATQKVDADSNAGFVTITIRSGQSSLSAANACRDAGLVEDASEFDLFLCHGGYDRMLKTGNYQIKKGASVEEIAKALTGKN